MGVGDQCYALAALPLGKMWWVGPVLVWTGFDLLTLQPIAACNLISIEFIDKIVV